LEHCEKVFGTTELNISELMSMAGTDIEHLVNLSVSFKTNIDVNWHKMDCFHIYTVSKTLYL